MEENKSKVVYSYDRSSYNDEEARKRYTAYMQKMMAQMSQQQTGGKKG